MPGAFTGTKRRLARGDNSCSARATRSLPVPVSPKTCTRTSLAPNCLTSRRMDSIAGQRPTRPASAPPPLCIRPSLLVTCRKAGVRLQAAGGSRSRSVTHPRASQSACSLTARNAYSTMAHVLRFLTAGESHGPALTVVVEGLPAGVPVERERIDADLRRRQGGYGRGGRMQIEQDAAEILSGGRHGRSLGSPIALLVRNRDHENWKDVMSPEPQPDAARERRRLRYPRPGHADLA